MKTTPSWSRRAIFAKLNRARLRRRRPEECLYSRKRLVLEIMRPVWRQRQRALAGALS